MADSSLKIPQMLREAVDDRAKLRREQDEEDKKKKRGPKVFFILTVQSDSSYVDSHENKRAHDEHQRPQRYKNRQEGGQCDWCIERERDSGRSGETGGQAPGGDDPRGRKSDSEDEDSSPTDEDSDSDEESEDEDSSEEIIQELSVRMGLLNVQSVMNKLPQTSDLINQYGLKVLFLTETWLQSGSGDEVLRQRWTEFLQQPRDQGRGGGVAVLFPGALEYDRINFEVETSFEYLVVLMRHGEWHRPILTITLYRPPRTKVRKFLEELQQLLNQVSNQYESILLTGDFNIWVDEDNSRHARRFRQFLEANGFLQHVNQPTYRSCHTLDLVISRNVEVSNVVVQNNEISDHYTVLFSVRPVSKHMKRKNKKKMKKTKKEKKKNTRKRK